MTYSCFFFTDSPTTYIYTLSLHDALPISESNNYPASNAVDGNTSSRWSTHYNDPQWIYVDLGSRDRKSTRLNSSHPSISYAVFCLKKKNILMTKKTLNSAMEAAEHSYLIK